MCISAIVLLCTIAEVRYMIFTMTLPVKHGADNQTLDMFLDEPRPLPPTVQIFYTLFLAKWECREMHRGAKL